jgi:orotate phosphoribosyltransferase-like protein
MWWKTDRRAEVAASIGRPQLRALDAKAVAKAKAMREEGFTYRRIASDLGVSDDTVTRALTREANNRHAKS